MANNNNMMPNMFPNNQNFNCFNNNCNNFIMNNGMNMNMNNGMNMNINNSMNMNMNNNMPFMPNMNIQQLNLGGAANWQGIYTPQGENQNGQQMQNNGNMVAGKVNAILTTTRGVKVNMKIDYGKRVCDLIKLYFKLINREDLINNPQDLVFIYNANRMNINDQTPVERFFNSGFARITINDTRGLIGAKDN